MKIEITRVSDGFIARPAGQLGTCGWSPFPWTATWGRGAEAARLAFQRDHAKHLGDRND